MTDELVFQEEAITSELLDEMIPKMAQHHREIAHYKDVRLEPDFEHYLLGYLAGAYRCYVVRSAGVLVGYAVFVVRFHPHYKSCLQAFQDSLYLSPGFRRGFNGLRFIRWCEGRLAGLGVKVVSHSVTSELDYSSVLIRLGYEPAEINYSKRIG